MQSRIRATRDQRKLMMSLVANFATRIPGTLGVIFFLPLLRFGLGADRYGLLLTALALGSAAGFLFGGIGTMARRVIGEAHARGDLQAEADGFRTLTRACLVVAAFSIVLGGLYAASQNSSAEVILVALLPILAGATNMFDNIRAAYNEQYVTSVLLLASQGLFYAIGFLVPAMQHALVPAAMILVGSSAVASLVALALLLRERPHLLRGRAEAIMPILRQGIAIALADGMLLTSLNVAVVVLQASETSEASAWFATLIRLFWSLLTPVILVLLPVSSYVRLQWGGKSHAQRKAVLLGTLALCFAYALIVAAALFALSKLYIGDMLHLATPGQWWQMAAVFAFLGAIVVFKSYANIAYAVLDANYLSAGTAAGLAIAAALAAACALVAHSMLTVVAVYSAAATLGIAVVLFLAWRQFDRNPG